MVLLHKRILNYKKNCMKLFMPQKWKGCGYYDHQSFTMSHLANQVLQQFKVKGFRGSQTFWGHRPLLSNPQVNAGRSNEHNMLILLVQMLPICKYVHLIQHFPENKLHLSSCTRSNIKLLREINKLRHCIICILLLHSKIM